ncbi:hypothetical protein WICPIJ_001512 [Wickerhamomyces pijperi]|uniref:CHY-type domain-containing protein n=1 Tax=Wickerhamomyces pijperi TaxID=599730 RepID=A0A9P8QDF4_WICPI|nr:hypothetical protein WICPIJ_001512 [Wickerhamomyces pijperi]
MITALSFSESEPYYELKGQFTDTQTRCIHYHTELDIIALKFKCCQTYYPCFQCHQENKHPTVKYCQQDLDQGEKVVLCGVCKSQLTFKEYLNAGNYRCINCESRFNPGCELHYDLYFDMKNKENNKDITGDISCINSTTSKDNTSTVSAPTVKLADS